MAPKINNKHIWELDGQTLDIAYLTYQSLPMADRHKPFGEWFLDGYYIPGIVEWAALMSEQDDKKAYFMLDEYVVITGGRKR